MSRDEYCRQRKTTGRFETREQLEEYVKNEHFVKGRTQRELSEDVGVSQPTLRTFLRDKPKPPPRKLPFLPLLPQQGTPGDNLSIFIPRGERAWVPEKPRNDYGPNDPSTRYKSTDDDEDF